MGALVGLQQVPGGSLEAPGTLPGQAPAAGGAVHDGIDLCCHCGTEGLHPREIDRGEVEAACRADFELFWRPVAVLVGLEGGGHVVLVQFEVPAALDVEHGVDVQQVVTPQDQGQQSPPVEGFRPRAGEVEPVRASAVRHAVGVRGVDERCASQKIEVEPAWLEAVEGRHGAQLRQFVGGEGLQGVAAQR
ncbi:hypothetical protein ACWEP4_30585 [Streptomyces sp. NPDC004227]